MEVLRSVYERSSQIYGLSMLAIATTSLALFADFHQVDYMGRHHRLLPGNAAHVVSDTINHP